MLKLFAASLLLSLMAIPSLAASDRNVAKPEVACPGSACTMTCCTKSDKNTMICHDRTECTKADKSH